MLVMRRNLVMGLVASVWSAMVGFVAVPFYLKYLGIEAYGLIGFFVTLQTILQLLDMGISSSLNREVARGDAVGNIRASGPLLHSLAVLYWCIGACIAICLALAAPLFSKYWLQSNLISDSTVTHAVMLMGLVIGCRWPIGLYQGAMLGAQRMAESSAISMLTVTLGGVGAIFVLAEVSATLGAFFVWQAVVALTHALLIRRAAWKAVGREQSLRFNLDNVKGIMHLSLGLGAITLAGVALTQIDKLILSKTLPLDVFAKYVLAGTFAGSIYMLTIPVFNAIYPKFSGLVELQLVDELSSLYENASRFLSGIVFSFAMVLALFAQPLIAIWTGDTALAGTVAPLAALLLFAYSLHCVMYVPYAVMLAHGSTKPWLKMHFSLILTIVPLSAGASLLYGIQGAAIAQVVLFVIYFCYGLRAIKASYFPIKTWAWLLKDTLIPFCICLVFGVIAYQILPLLPRSFFLQFGVGFLLWIFVVFSCLLSSSGARSMLKILFKRGLTGSTGYKNA